MELIQKDRRFYAPPTPADQEARRRAAGSQALEPPVVAKDPEYDIRASYGPSPWVQQHDCSVRGVPVSKLALREGDKHVWCLFPDGRCMIVAEANIKAIKRRRS
ncbi:MAG: hypothetical protein ACHQ9S_19040 [Candidatus Binatia bacterium]